MNNLKNYMDAHFERTKNIKALGITIGICLALFLLMFLISWTTPQIPPPLVDEGIEVNLGNSDQGMGDIAPAIPGTPSENVATQSNPPAAAQSQPADANEADENEVIDATPIAAAPKNDKKTSTIKPAVDANKNTKAEPLNTPPAPPKPKAVYAGGTKNGTGGNNADSYNGVNNQGIAGGKGDQGKANGNPNSDSYTGNGGTGKSGVSIRSGLSGRRITRFPSFEDDFNTPAKVAVDVHVDNNGTVTSATVNPRGTTTTNANIRAIAIRKAKELKFNNASDEAQQGTIVFDFKIRG